MTLCCAAQPFSGISTAGKAGKSLLFSDYFMSPTQRLLCRSTDLPVRGCLCWRLLTVSKQGKKQGKTGKKQVRNDASRKACTSEDPAGDSSSVTHSLLCPLTDPQKHGRAPGRWWEGAASWGWFNHPQKRPFQSHRDLEPAQRKFTVPQRPYSSLVIWLAWFLKQLLYNS